MSKTLRIFKKNVLRVEDVVFGVFRRK